LQLTSFDRWLLSLPLFHVGGLSILFRCFLQGATVVLSDHALSDALLKHQVTFVSLVPTQLYRLLKEDTAKIENVKKHLKCVLLGGAALGDELFSQARAAGFLVVTSYGMTEMSSIISADKHLFSQSVGKPLEYREVTIKDEGEIYVRGKTLFAGYLFNHNEITKTLDADGWFATSDLGTINAEGLLEILGRKDRMFISGGENIHPEEIERALCRLPGVYEACVVPIDDPEFGQRPIAYLRTEGHQYTLDEICELLREMLPSFKHPTALHPLPNLSENLKINRQILLQNKQK